MNDAYAKKYCKDVFGSESDDVFQLVKPAVDGYMDRHKRSIDEEMAIGVGLYYVAETNLHRRSISEAGTLEDRRERIIEQLEKRFGKSFAVSKG